MWISSTGSNLVVGDLLILLSWRPEIPVACTGSVGSGCTSGGPLVIDLLDVAEVDLRVLSATGDVNPLLCSVLDILVALPPLGK